eukprot:2716611-Rhodomonas_salina.4
MQNGLEDGDFAAIWLHVFACSGGRTNRRHPAAKMKGHISSDEHEILQRTRGEANQICSERQWWA